MRLKQTPVLVARVFFTEGSTVNMASGIYALNPGRRVDESENQGTERYLLGCGTVQLIFGFTPR
jgi:hypothetical protein